MTTFFAFNFDSKFLIMHKKKIQYSKLNRYMYKVCHTYGWLPWETDYSVVMINQTILLTTAPCQGAPQRSITIVSVSGSYISAGTRIALHWTMLWNLLSTKYLRWKLNSTGLVQSINSKDFGEGGGTKKVLVLPSSTIIYH